jgi:hypothetical protein
MTLLEAKAIAKEMKERFGITHAQALHEIAKDLGYKSWTALLSETNIKEKK